MDHKNSPPQSYAGWAAELQKEIPNPEDLQRALGILKILVAMPDHQKIVRYRWRPWHVEEFRKGMVE
jgi:hypothetical protein